MLRISSSTKKTFFNPVGHFILTIRTNNYNNDYNNDYNTEMRWDAEQIDIALKWMKLISVSIIITTVSIIITIENNTCLKEQANEVNKFLHQQCVMYLETNMHFIKISKRIKLQYRNKGNIHLNKKCVKVKDVKALMIYL